MAQKILLIIMVTIFLIPAWGAKKVITVTTDIWCPYICEPKSKLPGYMIEILKEILTSKGYEIELKVMKWNDGVKQVREGKITGLLGTTKEDVPDFLFPNKELGVATFHIFLNKKSNWRYEGLSSLVGRKIGVIDGNIYDKLIMQYMTEKNPSLDIDKDKNPLQSLIRKLDAGKIDGIYEDPNVLNYTLRQLNKENNYIDNGPIEKFRVSVYLALSPKYPESYKINAELDKGIERLRSSGKLQKILNKYHMKDWEK